MPYIDLNAVRAQIVETPGAYRWCGHGAAVRGNTLSRNGICAMVASAYLKSEVAFETVLQAYDSAIEGFIEQPAKEESGGQETESREHLKELQAPRKFVREMVESVLADGGKLTLFEMLRCKVRHFSHGLAIGPESFVREVAKTLKLSKDSSRRCEWCDEVELYTARWLRGEDKVSIPKRRVA